MAQKVESRLQGELSAYAQTTLARAKKGRNPNLPAEISTFAENVAEAHWLLYGEHDSIKALDLLLARKADLRRVLDGSIDEADSDVWRATHGLTLDVKRLLDDLGPNGFQNRVYPPNGKPTSQVADELFWFLFPEED